jgi:predicted nuclease of restriction endonuclease-like (RecB) superfamily
MSVVNDEPLPDSAGSDLESYGAFLADAKRRIQSARARAARAVNAELIGVYWYLGSEILARQAAEGSGSGRSGTRVIPRLSSDLQAAFPGMGGLSVRNLEYMRKFAAAWPEPEMAQHVAALLPWGHNILLLDKLNDPAELAWYAEQAAENGWTRKLLEHHITTGLRAAQGAAITNFAERLPEIEARAAQQITRDPLVLDFIQVAPDSSERDIERALVGEIQEFMVRLGQGFLYAGRQHPVRVGERDFNLDLLFYHHPTRRWIVIELKLGRFEPEYVGKLNFYVNAVDQQLAGPDDRATIGMLLCASRDEAVVRVTLRGIESPLAVVRYRTRGDRLDVDRRTGAAISPGMRVELEEMRDVEERLATWATGRIASLERPDPDPDAS